MTNENELGGLRDFGFFSTTRGARSLAIKNRIKGCAIKGGYLKVTAPAGRGREAFWNNKNLHAACARTAPLEVQIKCSCFACACSQRHVRCDAGKGRLGHQSMERSREPGLKGRATQHLVA